MGTSVVNPVDNGASSSDGTALSSKPAPPVASDAQQQLNAITSRTHNDNALEKIYSDSDSKVDLDGITDGEVEQQFQPENQAQPSISDQTKFSSTLSFTPLLDFKNNPVSRCNTISNDNLSRCLSSAFLTFRGTSKIPLDEGKLQTLFNTALAWHIAEYRPTAVTHGKILDVDAQVIYDALINKDRGITIRRIARAWSPAISNVLYSYANLTPPVFTTQCNDTFADPHTRIAVAPFFFDGIDPGIIPVNLSRLVATGLAYSKRQATNSPYSLHKRPAFVTQKAEDLNMAMQFTG